MSLKCVSSDQFFVFFMTGGIVSHIYYIYYALLSDKKCAMFILLVL